MKKVKRPSFQFYPADFLADPVAMGFHPSILGAYIKLLCFDWLDDGLPDSDKELAKLGGLPSKLKKEGVQRLRLKFIKHPHKAGCITNPRLIKERLKQDEHKENASRAGKASAQQRANRKATEGATNSKSSSSSSSSTSSLKIKTLKPLSGKPDISPAAEVIQYLNHRAQKNFHFTEANKKPIRARFTEGFKLEDFKKAVDNMIQLWTNDPKMNRFLRPTTLFGTKMDGYLNNATQVKETRAPSKAEQKRAVGDNWLKNRREKNDGPRISTGVKGILE